MKRGLVNVTCEMKRRELLDCEIGPASVTHEPVAAVGMSRRLVDCPPIRCVVVSMPAPKLLKLGR
jgi:hypothetical protein